MGILRQFAVCSVLVPLVSLAAAYTLQTIATAMLDQGQWLKCHRTPGNAVPPLPIFSSRRSLTSNFQKTQGTLRGTLWHASNRISAYCALDFCTVLPFLRLRIHVKDVNVNA